MTETAAISPNAAPTPSPAALDAAVVARVAAGAACLSRLVMGTVSGSRLRRRVRKASPMGNWTGNWRKRLVGPPDLAGLRYADGKGLDVKVAKARLDLRYRLCCASDGMYLISTSTVSMSRCHPAA